MGRGHLSQSIFRTGLRRAKKGGWVMGRKRELRQGTLRGKAMLLPGKSDGKDLNFIYLECRQP